MDDPPSYDDATQGWSFSSSTNPFSSNFFPQFSIDEINTEEPTQDGSITKATLLPYANFKTSEDVENLRAALHSDDKTNIIQILCRRTADQRLDISRFYSRLCGVSLSRDIKNRLKESPSDFAFLMTGLSMPLFEFMARAIHNSYSYRWMCYIMFVLPNVVRHNMQKYFDEKYGMEIMKYVKAKIRSEAEHPDRWIVTQIERPTLCVRDEVDLLNQTEIKKDLNLLLTLNSKDALLKDMAKGMFYSKSFAHIKTVCLDYQRESGGSVEALVRKVFSKNKFVILNIIHYALNPIGYFASELHKYGRKVLGTDEKYLSSVCIIRSEVDMVDIKAEFIRVHGESLRAFIQSDNDSSEYFKIAIFELIGDGGSSASFL